VRPLLGPYAHLQHPTIGLLARGTLAARRQAPAARPRATRPAVLPAPRAPRPDPGPLASPGCRAPRAAALQRAPLSRATRLALIPLWDPFLRPPPSLLAHSE
jgi:hypothetical protein